MNPLDSSQVAQIGPGLNSDPNAYNIIPLQHADTGGYRQFPEILAALTLVEDAAGVLSTSVQSSAKQPDVFSWLQAAFGFQEDSVKNQREHLVMLLAAMEARLHAFEDKTAVPQASDIISAETVKALLTKLTGNYENWCSFHQLTSSILLPKDGAGELHVSVVYIVLWLLVWGEAANVRFMPECLCYIYHHMAKELGPILRGEVSQVEDGFVITDYLNEVIVPIYDVIAKEAQNSKLGDHSKWRNYDDLNEFFWSKRCHKLGWPMDQKNDFFGIVTQPAYDKNGQRLYERMPTGKEKASQSSGALAGMQPTASKENWVEVRTVLQIYRSFQRVWIFYILLFQALVILGWHAPAWWRVFEERKLQFHVLTVIITYAGCRVATALIDLLLSWKLRRSTTADEVFTNVLRFLYHAIFFGLLLFTYVWD